MLSRSMRMALGGRRLMSTRMTIVESAARFARVAAAKNDAELTAAKSATIDIDPHNLQGDVASLQGYLAAGAAGTQEPFVPDPNAWQNLPFLEYVKREYSRPANFWILIVGPVFYFLLVAKTVFGQIEDEEKIKKSLFMQQQDGLCSNHLPGEEHH